MPVNSAQYYLFHPLQGLGLYGLMSILRALPVDRASGFGAWIGRRIGPRLTRANHIARTNLEHCLPELSDDDRTALITRMWENLGRTITELPHLKELWQDRVDSSDRGPLDAARQAGMPIVIAGAHLGNWELGAVGTATHLPPAAVMFRPPNNRFADRAIRKLRAHKDLVQLTKSREGSRDAARLLAQGGTVAILMDQKLREGITVPFFGMPARTAYTAALYALRFKAALVPVCIVRTKGARFQMRVEEAIRPGDTGNRDEDVRIMTAQLNAVIEGWIRDNPDQWLWIHRRWDIPYGVGKR